MKHSKNVYIFLIVALTIYFSLFSVAASSQFSLSNAEKWNLHEDFQNDGITPLIDIRDLVCAKKLSASGSENCDARFLANLKKVLLGLAPDEDEKLNENGEIVLPIAP